MTQLKALTFAPLPKLTAADPVVQRRNKLIVRLQQQIALANDPLFTLSRSKWVANEAGEKRLVELRKRVRAWWRTGPTGELVLVVRYGARAISWEKGKEAILVGKKDKLVPIIEQVIAIVEAGSIDEILAQMSKSAVLMKGKRAA
jgi:hypothetical protein